MKRKFAGAGILLLLACRIGSQAVSHQRLGIEGAKNLLLMAGISIDMIGIGNNAYASLEIDPSFTFEALYERRLGLSVEVPVVVRLPLARGVAPRFLASPGDPGLAISYTFRVNDWRLGAELSYVHPLGIWNSHEADEKRIVSGSGYRKLGASFSCVRYMDPLVAGFAISADSYFEREELSGTGSKPLVLTVSLFATEALNHVVALSSGLSQRLGWPSLMNGAPMENTFDYSISGKVSLVFTEGRRTVNLGISRLLSEITSPIVFNLEFTLRLSEKEG